LPWWNPFCAFSGRSAPWYDRAFFAGNRAAKDKAMRIDLGSLLGRERVRAWRLTTMLDFYTI
jgi:hypothetical protein